VGCFLGGVVFGVSNNLLFLVKKAIQIEVQAHKKPSLFWYSTPKSYNIQVNVFGCRLSGYRYITDNEKKDTIGYDEKN
jgi:hypothetical protein